MMILKNPRREVVLVLFFTILGASIRLWNFNRLGLTHFDEGIYAFKGLWSLSPEGLKALDRELIAYAPPIYPILIGVGYWVSPWGMSDLSAIFVSTLCGIAAIPLVGRLGVRGFGSGVGASTTALACFAGPQIAFSRTALTDATFLLFWLAAIALGLRFLEKPGSLRAIVFGVAVGLAQNVKYNGWLAGFIVGWALLWNASEGRGSVRQPFSSVLKYLAIAATFAIAVDLPWIAFVQTHGGYADLIRHQRSYTDPAAWLAHWRLQLNQSIALSGGSAFNAGAWIAASISCLACRTDRSLPRTLRGKAMVAGFVLLGVPLLTVLPILPWWVALASVVRLSADRRPGPRLLAIWWIVSTAITPIYHPYARLWLPVHAATWLIFADSICRAFDRIFEAESIGFGSAKVFGRFSPATIGLCVVAAIGFAWGERGAVWKPLPGLLAPTDELRSFASGTVVADLEKRGARLIRVYARPCVTFYLRTNWNGRVAVYADSASFERDADPRIPSLLDGTLRASGASLGVERKEAGFGLIGRTRRRAGLSSSGLDCLPALLDRAVSDRLDSERVGREPDPVESAKKARVWYFPPEDRPSPAEMRE